MVSKRTISVGRYVAADEFSAKRSMRHVVVCVKNRRTNNECIARNCYISRCSGATV